MEVIESMAIEFHWDSQERPELSLIRQKYELDKIIEDGKTDFEKIMLLKNWVFKKLKQGNNPRREYHSSLEILDDSENDGEFYCSHFAQVFIECSTALGFKARKVGVDSNHELGEEEMHHGIADIWDPVHGKWMVVDAMHNLHFEKDSVPLSVLEVRNEYIRNGGKGIEGVIGNNERRIQYSGTETGLNTPSNYFWFFVYTDNGTDMWKSPTLLYIDENNKNKTWYRGGKNKGDYLPHPMYQGQFVTVTNPKIIFPVL
jgi:hypothetical protein